MKTDRTTHRLLAYLARVRGSFAVSLGLLLLASAVTAAKAWITQPAVDTFREGAVGPKGLLSLCGAVFRETSRQVRRLSRLVQEAISDLSRQLTEMLEGLEVVLSFGLAACWRLRFRELNAEHYGRVLRLQKASFGSVAFGLDTPISPHGFRLSGGQRQRIAIARTLLMNPRVLILDEATAALDAALERLLLGNLVQSYRQCTVLAITHRSGVAAVADRVLILRDGLLEKTGLTM